MKRLSFIAGAFALVALMGTVYFGDAIVEVK